MPALAPALFRPGAGARTAPDNPARTAFVARHPCPETSSYGVCLDVVDHVIPLCAQPAFLATVLDTPANMAWEPAAESEVKDRYERRLCRALERADSQLVARIGVTPGFEDLISWPGTSVQQ